MGAVFEPCFSTGGSYVRGSCVRSQLPFEPVTIPLDTDGVAGSVSRHIVGNDHAIDALSKPMLNGIADDVGFVLHHHDHPDLLFHGRERYSASIVLARQLTVLPASSSFHS
jgi:hypothetical protein